MQSDVKVLKFQKRWQGGLNPNIVDLWGNYRNTLGKTKCVGEKSEICWRGAQILLEKMSKNMKDLDRH